MCNHLEAQSGSVMAAVFNPVIFFRRKFYVVDAQQKVQEILKLMNKLTLEAHHCACR